MVAESLISDIIIPLRTSTTGEEALEIMSDFNVRHLPIVNREMLLGLVSEEDILDNDATEAVGSYELSVLRPFVRSNDHLYEVMRLIADNRITVIPVVDLEDNYKGMITLEDVLQYFVTTGSFTDPGSILVLEMAKRDYSLSEIARLVESEGAVILSCLVMSQPNSEQIQVTVKINRTAVESIVATLERFNYYIKASFNEEEYRDSLQDRYDSLLHYLNV